MSKWYYENGDQGDVVISSRVRLARNLNDYPFPCRLNSQGRQEVCKRVWGSLEGIKALKLSYIDMAEMDSPHAVALAERHLISPEFAAAAKGRGLILSEDESVSIMINEEDHIRLQVIKSGFALDEAFSEADRLDSLLDESLKYAFDERLGYLTQCPTNLGTGMRASVMLHLPALTKLNRISRLASTVSKLGMVIRGTYGEGSGALGDVYQLSNQVTLGISEKSALDNLKSIALQIATRERTARDELSGSIDFEDRICRAYGILTTARLINTEEMTDLMSYCRLGVAAGMLPLDMQDINEIMVTMQPANLMCSNPECRDAPVRDEVRARLIREKLSKK